MVTPRGGKVRKARESFAEGLIREAKESAGREIDRRRILAATRDRDQLAAAKQRIAALETELANAAQLEAAIAHLESNPLAPMAIAPRESDRVCEATAVVVLSDLHLEETVDPAEVNGLNAYNLEIASDRMDRLAIGLVWQLELARSKYQIRDLVIECIGDITTNYLRVEDVQGNALTPFEAIVFAEGQLVRFVRTVLERCPWLERVIMPFLPGNHDRLAFSKSTQYRKRTAMSSAPVLAHGIARELSSDPRFRLELSTGEHHYTDVYGRLLRGMHGDRFNYQGGVGGLYIPARRHVTALNKIRHAALTVFGHWHTSRVDRDWISNGSLIGLNAYSLAKGLEPEPPSQTFFLIDRDRGKRLVTPIQVGDRDEWS